VQNDSTRRFLFEHFDIRGELTQLDQSYTDLLSTHHYPAPIARLLGEFASAAVLLSSNIKFEGRLSLQSRGSGPLPLLMVECTSEQCVRGLAQMSNQPVPSDFQQLLSSGTLALTIEPDRGERYQGIVPLQGTALAECLQYYFRQSEQVETRFILAADDARAAGVMLQQLPRQLVDDDEARTRQWEHVTTLLHTLTPAELLTLAPEAILRRLYHEDVVRLYPPRPVQYRCSCSSSRSAKALRLLGRAEIDAILAEQGQLEMTCEFCNQVYRFDRGTIAAAFDDAAGDRADPLH
jgi:molecular chaperone Hsp33